MRLLYNILKHFYKEEKLKRKKRDKEDEKYEREDMENKMYLCTFKRNFMLTVQIPRKVANHAVL